MTPLFRRQKYCYYGETFVVLTWFYWHKVQLYFLVFGLQGSRDSWISNACWFINILELWIRKKEIGNSISNFTVWVSQRRQPRWPRELYRCNPILRVTIVWKKRWKFRSLSLIYREGVRRKGKYEQRRYALVMEHPGKNTLTRRNQKLSNFSNVIMNNRQHCFLTTVS